ncbi:hypothetical protein L7F22_038687 [Adiantum nelumboides]|nr:hypothetical protein [Adiantum nelumboides]
MDPRMWLSGEAEYDVKYLDEALRKRAIICRLVDSSPPRQRGRISDWLQAALSPTEQKQRLIMMGRGLFIVIMMSEPAVHSLAARLPLSMGRCILFGVPYYDQFEVGSFEDVQQIPEVRSRMIDVVDSGKGVLEVTLKHSGSLFMYAGTHGGAFAKNSYGNLYSAVGVFVLGRTLQEAWGVEATAKQREFNAYLEKHKLCISMELVTAVLGDHGQRPLKDYVVVTAVSDLKNKPRFYSTSDIVAFCREWRLPTNDVWLFSSRKSATSFFTAYDALCEDGTATTVYKVMNEVADICVEASKSHMEVQGEILEGLVARIVTPSSSRRLESVLKEFPLTHAKDQKELRPTLRDICSSNKGTEDQQVKALLQAIGPSMCSDWSDWNDKTPDPVLFNKFMSAKPVDNMTCKLQEMIHLLRERRMQARYPCRVKELDRNEGKVIFRLTVHILSDMVFRNYQKELRRSPGLWPLYRDWVEALQLIELLESSIHSIRVFLALFLLSSTPATTAFSSSNKTEKACDNKDKKKLKCNHHKASDHLTKKCADLKAKEYPRKDTNAAIADAQMQI